MVRKFPTIKGLREHLVKFHKIDFCELCIDQKPVLMFEQPLFRYEALQRHIDSQHPACFFCPTKYFYDVDKLNIHYRQNHYFCDVCKKLGKRVREKSKKRMNLPEYEVFKDMDEL